MEQTQQQTQQQTEPRAPHQDAQLPMEERILTPEETESLLRGFTVEPEQSQQRQEQPAEQQQMVRDFVREVPYPHEQIAQAQQQQQMPPSQPSQELLEQAVTQMAPGQQPEPQQVPVQQQQPPQDSALMAQNALLQQQVNSLAQQLQALTQQPQQQQQVQPAQAPQPQQQPQEFNFQVPPQFLAGLFGEDDNMRAVSLNHLLNGVANSVAAQMRAESQEQLTQLRGEVSGMVNDGIRSSVTAQEVQRDMYGTYPELSPYRELVQATARQVGREQPALSDWSPDLRDMIAERLSPMVPGLYQKVQQMRATRLGMQQVPQQPQPQPLPQQQAMPQPLPPGVQPVGVVGGVHGQAPTLARDAQGNLVYVQSPPQPYLGGPQARPDGRGVDPQMLDIWQTLGYPF